MLCWVFIFEDGKHFTVATEETFILAVIAACISCGRDSRTIIKAERIIK